MSCGKRSSQFYYPRQGIVASVLHRVKERRCAENMASLLYAEGLPHGFQSFIPETFGHLHQSGLVWLRKYSAYHPTEYMDLLRRFSVVLRRHCNNLLAIAAWACTLLSLLLGFVLRFALRLRKPVKPSNKICFRKRHSHLFTF